jgi:type VI secretion system lysozyme-like protein
MSQVRLLKRLTSWQQGKSPKGDSLSIQESILLDVESLLNSQQGNILIDDAMGLNDLQGHFNSHGAPDLEELTTHISTQISLYEPRLKNVRLSLDEEHKNLSSFSWRLASVTNNELDVFASIIINADGRVSIRSAV